MNPCRCKYVAGRAEDVFQELRYHLPSRVDLDKSRVIGVVDPPRAGIHARVVTGIRKVRPVLVLPRGYLLQLTAMRRLVFVSCHPAAASKNLVDLCRPASNKYGGEPFRLVAINPVDMFPQTKHQEWVVMLER